MRQKAVTVRFIVRVLSYVTYPADKAVVQTMTSLTPLSEFQAHMYINPGIAFGVKKTAQAQFLNNKNLCWALGRVVLLLFVDMEWAQNATIGEVMNNRWTMPIGEVEIIRYDVKHVWIFWNWQKFTIMLTTMTKPIHNKYCCNLSDRV